MVNDQGIDERVYQNPAWTSQQIVTAVKQAAGKMYLDCRKWTTGDKPAPLRGVMLSLEDWPGVIKNIQELLDSHYNQNGKG